MMIETVKISAKGVSGRIIDEMLSIMQEYYVNIDRPKFLSDLRGKEWAILLKDNDKLCGFSTVKLFNYTFKGKDVHVSFSGDTIIRKEYWRSFALPLAWGRLMFSILEEDPDRELYWLLTSKGYKTYRFLPVFFKKYYPSCLKTNFCEMDVKDLLKSIAKDVFGDRIDGQKMILKAQKGSQRLKKGVADIDDVKRKNIHIRFFEKVNPGHIDGDELICFARIHENNLIPNILRRLRNG